jgi:hypothetical protein
MLTDVYGYCNCGFEMRLKTQDLEGTAFMYSRSRDCVVKVKVKADPELNEGQTQRILSML